jgi:adenylate cyclase
LIVAEVELKSEDQTFDKPVWAGDEVTYDTRYFNANLVFQALVTISRRTSQSGTP